MFRKAALERLSSPEELDQAMHVTRPRGWLALLALVGLLVAGLVWVALVTVPITVSGRGVLTNQDPAGGALQAVVFVSLEDGAKIQPGMPAKIDLAAARKEQFGLALGTVQAVDPLPATEEAMGQALGNNALAAALAAAGDIIEVHIDLAPDPATPSGVQWSSKTGPPLKLQKGMLGNAIITVAQQQPLSLIIPH